MQCSRSLEIWLPQRNNLEHVGGYTADYRADIEAAALLGFGPHLSSPEAVAAARLLLLRTSGDWRCRRGLLLAFGTGTRSRGACNPPDSPAIRAREGRSERVRDARASVKA